MTEVSGVGPDCLRIRFITFDAGPLFSPFKSLAPEVFKC
jgi:hypothetical protein